MFKKDEKNTAIIAKKVPERQRSNAMPKHIGRYYMNVEQAIFMKLDEYSKSYSGGYFEFMELSNGGFYLSLSDDEEFHIVNPNNYYEGTLSADAYSLAACLMVYSDFSLMLEGERQEHFSTLFHKTREYALTHPEASAIFAFID